MSALGELLDGAVRADAERLTGVAFAADRYASVRGRVARRRAARSAGVGGASVLGIGALAVGVTHLPFASPGLAGPGSAVVCTTVAAAAPTPSADSALSVLNVPSPSGSVIWSIAIGSQDPPEIVANIALDLTTHEVTGSIPDGNSYVYTSLTLTKNADGVYAARLPDGTPLTFEVKDENLVLKGSTLEPMGEPTVTCVTVDPAPTSSAVPSSSLEPSATPVAMSPTAEPTTVPGLAWSWDPDVPAGTPFQCDYHFPVGEFDSPGLTVSGHATTQSAVRQAFMDEYGDQPPTSDVADSQGLAYAGTLDLADPHILVSGPNQPLAQSGGRGVGATFVAVRDGVVVGVIVPPADGTQGIVLDHGVAGPFEANFWELDAMTACGWPGLENADIYFVGALAEKNGAFFYSWTKVSE